MQNSKLGVSLYLRARLGNGPGFRERYGSLPPTRERHLSEDFGEFTPDDNDHRPHEALHRR